MDGWTNGWMDEWATCWSGRLYIDYDDAADLKSKGNNPNNNRVVDLIHSSCPQFDICTEPKKKLTLCLSADMQRYENQH